MRLRACVVAAVVLVGAQPARGYTLASGFTQSCHERITLAAFGVLLDQLDATQVSLPASDLWRKVSTELAPAVLETMGQSAAMALTDQQRFILFSAVIGVRSPDTGGHSVSNLDALRRAQTDPDPTSQYLHCLRAHGDDGLEGDLAVLRGAKGLVNQMLVDAAATAARTGPARNRTEPFYLDFYGQLDVDVDESAYLIGRAMHVLQDSFSHTLRSQDGRTVQTVLNYIDAISGHLDQNRDGMGHSDSMDDCRRDDLSPVVMRAAAVSSAAARAAIALARDHDDGPLARGLARCTGGESDTATCDWLEYAPACEAALGAGDAAAQAQCCSSANDYCAAPTLAIAREKLTRPYLQAVLGCQAAPGRPVPVGALALVPAILVGLRRRRAKAAGLVLLAVAAARPAQAGQLFATAEGHLSLLSDVPERSTINATMGYALRGGYRWDRWAALVHVERNHWLPTELSRAVEPGALDIGVGAEYLAAGGRVRLSLVAGPSILWFDTALDGKGTVGLFVDARPAGLRWRLANHLWIDFDPLAWTLVAPVLGLPGIRQLEYRTLLGLELGHF